MFEGPFLFRPGITHHLLELEGPATELDIEAQEILRLRKHLYEILSNATGRDEATIEHDCDRNKWLDAKEAVEYGCVDKILESMPEAKKEDRAQ